MNPLLRDSVAHVFVESLSAPELGGDDEHHLDRVLRVAETETVTVSDGQRRWTTARWSRRGGLELTGEVVEEPLRPSLAIGCAIAKGDRGELVVQKLTELGIDRIALFETSRSVVRWDAAQRSKQRERLSRIAREAAMQSRRVVLPSIEFTTFTDAVERDGVAIADVDGRDPLDRTVRSILIGPEGGFDRDELAARIPVVALSDNVLRVETAAIAAAVILVSVHRDGRRGIRSPMP